MMLDMVLSSGLFDDKDRYEELSEASSEEYSSFQMNAKVRDKMARNQKIHESSLVYFKSLIFIKV